MKRWRKKLTFICAVCLVFSIVLNLRALYTAMKNPVIDYLCPLPSWQRDNLYKDINHVMAQLHIHGGNQPWAKESEHILARLLRSLQSSSVIVPHPSNLLENESKVHPLPVYEVCREHYVHANLSYPYFLNGSWVKEKCQSQPINKLLTVVLYLPLIEEDCSSKIDFLLNPLFAEHKDINVVIGLKRKCNVNERPNVLFRNFKEESNEGEVWNKLVNSVQTPYVLIGRELERHSWFSQLERQIRILSDDSLVQIVGGSRRNQTGHWEVGCYQSDLRFYTLEYKDGYFASKNECMYCDYLKAPFIAKRSLFDAITFDENLEDQVVFEDFFLRMKENSYLVMNCPDAMYFVTDKGARQRETRRNSWLSLVKKWELNRVLLPDNIRHKYTCEESGSSCEDLQHVSGKRFIPICCMDRLANGFRAFHELCTKYNVMYYINGGSLLGAIKFRDIIPWDFDGDIIYYFSNYSFFKKMKDSFGDQKTLFLGDFDFKHYSYFRIKVPDIFIETDSLNETSIERSGMVKLFRNTPTLVRLRGQWLYGPPSPGLHARNMYGDEIFKHANSWYIQGHLWFEPYLIQRHFLPCKDPWHHSCYDKYPTDGSFPFLVP